MSDRPSRSILGWIGGGAAAVVVLASVLVRFTGHADPAADVSEQRAAVARFHELVGDRRWVEVYEMTTEPPARSAGAFAELMEEQVRRQGAVASVRAEGLRLLRSRTGPLLEVQETVTTVKDGRERTRSIVSYFARRGNAWLFAFSAPAET